MKMVSRFNLVFDQEDRRKLQERISEATRMRDQGELITMYHYTIDKI